MPERALVMLPLPAGGSLNNYVTEFANPSAPHSWGLEGIPSPDNQWRAQLVPENGLFGGSTGFYALRLVPVDPVGPHRTVCTLWESDPGSGTSFDARWSKDSKALNLYGTTGGFSHDRQRAFEINVIYIVESGEAYDQVRAGGNVAR